MKCTSFIRALVVEGFLASSSCAWMSFPSHHFPPPLIILKGSEGEGHSDSDYSGESDEVRLARARLMDSYSKVCEFPKTEDMSMFCLFVLLHYLVRYCREHLSECHSILYICPCVFYLLALNH